MVVVRDWSWVSNLDEDIDTCKNVLLDAQMKMGKTTAYVKHIQSNLKKYMRILVITNRRQQAATAMGNLKLAIPGVEWKIYSSIPSDEICNVNFLIVEYESLHLLKDAKPYNLVVMDEIRSLVATMTSYPTNKNNMRKNLETLQTFLRHRETVCLLMDADMTCDNAVQTFADNTWGPDQYLHIFYSHQKMKRQILKISKVMALANLHTYVQRGESAGIMCRTQIWANDLYSILTQYWGVPHSQILLFTGSSFTSHIMNFEKINRLISEQNVLYIVFTSVVTTGASIEVPFDHLFLFGDSPVGCTYRDAHQMVGRFREVKDQTIQFIKDDKDIYSSIDPEDIQSELEEESRVRVEYFSLLSSRTEEGGIDAPPVLNSIVNHKLLWDLYLFNEVECRRDFFDAFMVMALTKGYTFSGTLPDMVEEGMVDEYEGILAGTANDTREERSDLSFRAVLSIQDEIKLGHTVESVEDKLTLKCSAGDDLSPLDQRTLGVCGLMKLISPDKLKVLTARDYEWLVAVSRKAPALQRLQQVVKGKGDLSRLSDVYGTQDRATMLKSDFLEKTPVVAGPVYLLHQALTLLGFQGVSDMTSEVSTQRFETYSETVQSLCDRACQMDSRRLSVAGGEGPKNAAVFAVRRELEGQLGLKLSASKGKRKGFCSISYLNSSIREVVNRFL